MGNILSGTGRPLSRQIRSVLFMLPTISSSELLLSSLNFLPELVLCLAIVGLLFCRLFKSLDRWHFGGLALFMALLALMLSLIQWLGTFSTDVQGLIRTSAEGTAAQKAPAGKGKDKAGKGKAPAGMGKGKEKAGKAKGKAPDLPPLDASANEPSCSGALEHVRKRQYQPSGGPQAKSRPRFCSVAC